MEALHKSLQSMAVSTVVWCHVALLDHHFMNQKGYHLRSWTKCGFIGHMDKVHKFPFNMQLQKLSGIRTSVWL